MTEAMMHTCTHATMGVQASQRTSCPLGIYSEELQKSDSIPRIDIYGQAIPLVSDSILFLNSLCFHKSLLVGSLAVKCSINIPSSVEFLEKYGGGNLEVSHCREQHGVE